MFRIDGPGATNDNKFTEGDPANGTRATVVTDEWLNAVQEEIATVVEQSGLSLDKSDSGQLLEALKNSSKFSNIGSVAEGFAGRAVVQDLVVFAPSWHSGGKIGGGVFVGMANIAKSSHDGGLFISPTVPAVSAQAGADENERVGNYNGGAGETDPTGDGVYVRIDPIFSPRAYGARYDGGDDSSAIASYDALAEPKGAELVSYTSSSSVSEELDQAGFTPVLAADCDALTGSGTFYTDGSSLNRPLGESGTLIQIEVDSNTATQNYVTFSTNQALFRAKVAGVWATWQLISAQEIFTAGWPTIEGDNLLSEVATNTTSGWTIENGNTDFTSDGSVLTLDNLGGAAAAAVNRDVAMTDNGDYIFYCSLSAESIAGSYVTLQLGGPGEGRALVSLGYNWATATGEQNRISAAFGSGLNAAVGPVIDYSAGPVEIALLYNAEFQAGTLFIKEAGAWVGYGVVTSLDPYRTQIRFLQGGDDAASGTIHELFIAKPNIVSVGDSITEGATLYAPDPAEGLTNYASTWQAYANLYPNVRNNIIVNKGVGSQDSAQIDSRMAGILTDATPQVVFLQASANDYGSGFTLSQRTVNIQNSIDKIRNAGAKVALLNAVYPNADASCFPACGDFYREWWETQLGEIENANIKIDWMEGSGILSGGTYMDTAFTQPDGVHPNPAGHELLGDYVQSLEP